MKPVKFPEVNVTYAKDQDEYLPLPVCKSFRPEGDVVSCWQLSWKERFKILFTGQMWLSMWTFHKPLTPVTLSVYKKELIVPLKKGKTNNGADKVSTN